MSQVITLHPNESHALQSVSPNAQRLYKVARSMANQNGFISIHELYGAEMAGGMEQLESAIKGFVELVDNGLIRDLSNPKAQTICFGFPVYEAALRNRSPLRKGG